MKTVVRVEVNQGSNGRDNYVELLTTRCYLVNNAGSRTLEDSEVVLDSGWTMVIRFQTDIEDEIKPSMRFVAENRFFVIQSYKIIDLKKQYYQLRLTETES